MKWFGKILGIITILIAIYNFDVYNFNRSIVAILLFLSGVLSLSLNEKLNRIVRNTAVVLAVFLIMKILIVG